MNSREGVGVRIDAIEHLFLVLAGNAAEAGAGRVDENEVGDVEQALVVVDDRVGRGGRMAVVRRDHAPWPERAHVQPYRRGAGAAIVQEGDRAAVPVSRPS